MNQTTMRIVLFCLVVFLGAFLLFQIEPLIGKIVTLHYGGTASVWTICMLFFQAIMLAGYFTTYLLSKLTPRLQVIWYMLLALISIGWSIVPSGQEWDSSNVIEPVSGLLYSLTIHLAVPCILLATISGMMQLWFARQKLGNPYPLYSVSNVGSIGALLAYPILIEPSFTISGTLTNWSWLYWILITVLIVTAILTWQKLPSDNITPTTQLESSTYTVSPAIFIWWTLLSWLGSVTLLAYTSNITADIAPMPLLWVLPLSIYLLTFVLVFSNYQFYKRIPYILSWIVLVFIDFSWIVLVWIDPNFINQTFQAGVILNLLIVFVTCMICHGELSNSKPVASKLPTFYLAMAVGGAAGGVFVGIIAPSIFKFDAERLVVVFIMALALLYFFVLRKFIAAKNLPMILISIAMIVGGTIFVATLKPPKQLIHWERNFYGSVRVVKEGDKLTFCSGRINHGQQYIDPAKADLPAGPYQLPLKLIFESLHHNQPNKPFNYGDVGLGVAVLAAFGHEGDNFTFYELDPKVERIARTYFTYLSRTKAQTAVHIGDGRALLNNRPPQEYDLLLVDAFNGDAIPCHLVTKEAVQIYLKHLKEKGLLVFHISNTFVDLRAVLGNLAKALNLYTCTIRYSETFTYVVMCRDIKPVDQISTYYRQNIKSYPAIEISKTPTNPHLLLWTDDYTNIASVLKL